MTILTTRKAATMTSRSECTCGYHAPEQHGPNGCTMLGCGCKWDGLQAVVPDVAGALAALERLRKVIGLLSDGQLSSYFTVNAFLESVARERVTRQSVARLARNELLREIHAYMGQRATASLTAEELHFYFPIQGGTGR